MLIVQRVRGGVAAAAVHERVRGGARAGVAVTAGGGRGGDGARGAVRGPHAPRAAGGRTRAAQAAHSGTGARCTNAFTYEGNCLFYFFFQILS